MSGRTARAPRGGTKVAKEDHRRQDLFAKYATSEDPDAIGPDGIEAFCSDLGLDPSKRPVLVLAWKMGAARMGYFTRDEFSTGLVRLRATDLKTLKTSLERATQQLDSDPDDYQQFYMFAFSFCITEPGKKILDLESAIAMLRVVLPESDHLEPFTEFLQAQTEYKTVNRDQWSAFWRFSNEVEQDCSNFDEAEAWPLLLDNYVEWKSKQPQSSAN